MQHYLAAIFQDNLRTYCLLIYFPFVRFNGHLPGGPGLAGTRMSPFWILLELWVMEVVSDDKWSYKTCKAPVKSSPPTNQHPVFYGPDALPVAQPTVSKHWSLMNVRQRRCTQVKVSVSRRLTMSTARQILAATRNHGHYDMPRYYNSNNYYQGRLLHINDGANAPWKK